MTGQPPSREDLKGAQEVVAKTGVSTAQPGAQWDTCFELCFQKVLTHWEKQGK